jgi:hypothetical protein
MCDGSLGQFSNVTTFNTFCLRVVTRVNIAFSRKPWIDGDPEPVFRGIFAPTRLNIAFSRKPWINGAPEHSVQENICTYETEHSFLT